jgi:hypothetical protein
MDLVRELLIQITDNNLQPHENWSDEVIYHLKMLSDVSYIQGVTFMTTDQGWVAAPSYPRLTWDGHEFLETVRPKSVWVKIKKFVSDKGIGLTIDAIKIAAPYVIAKMSDSK